MGERERVGTIFFRVCLTRSHATRRIEPSQAAQRTKQLRRDVGMTNEPGSFIYGVRNLGKQGNLCFERPVPNIESRRLD